MTDPYARTPQGLLERMLQRIGTLEERRPGLPAALRDLGRGNTALRDSLYGTPSTAAERAALANRKVVWFNTDLGWQESYYATTGTAGLTVPGVFAGHPASWYPITPGVIFAHRGRTAGFQLMSTPSTPTEVICPASQVRRGGMIDSGNGSVVVPIGGHYRITGRVYFSGHGANGNAVIALRVNGLGVLDSPTYMAASIDQVSAFAVSTPIQAGQLVTLLGYASQSTNMYGTTGYNGSFIEVEYVGPPLVNG